MPPKCTRVQWYAEEVALPNSMWCVSHKGGPFPLFLPSSPQTHVLCNETLWFLPAKYRLKLHPLDWAKRCRCAVESCVQARPRNTMPALSVSHRTTSASCGTNPGSSAGWGVTRGPPPSGQLSNTQHMREAGQDQPGSGCPADKMQTQA